MIFILNCTKGLVTSCLHRHKIGWTGDTDMRQQKIETTELLDVKSRVLGPAVAAILLGVFIILGTGFAQSDVIHNAAHDSRHSFAFPCH